MISLLDIIPMIVAENIGPQRLERTPEPESVMDSEESVAEFNQVLKSKLVIAYAAALEVIHRARQRTDGGRALDIACGPGHFTLFLAKYLGYDEVIGVDLSPRMVEVARRNAEEAGLANRVRFEVGDATNLERFDAGEFDLASFTDAAHHMPTLHEVTAVLEEMERVTRPDGLVVVMDLVRLRTEKLTERYIRVIGQDYLDRGLPNFFNDFRNSMYAAWTPQELSSAVPNGTKRNWNQINQRGLPTIQFLLSLPRKQKTLYLRQGRPWHESNKPLPAEMTVDWKILRSTLFAAMRRPPTTKTNAATSMTWRRLRQVKL